ncbi:hypothetical protein ACFLZS_01015 [Patescibacteria group bacterium]
METRKLKLARILTTFVIFALLALTFVPGITNAAALTSLSDTMSRLKASTASNHTIKFTTPTGAADTSDTIEITMPTGFTIGSVVFGDMDLSWGPTTGLENEETLAAAAGAGVWGASFTGQVLSLDHPTDATGDITAGSVVVVEIGTNATSGTNQITNHATPATYTISIGGDFGDTGKIAIVVIADDEVVMSANVAPSITFTLSANTSDFGELSTGSVTTSSPNITLTIGTNSANGYLISVQDEGDTSDPGLYNSAGATDIIGSANSAYGNTATLAAGTEGYGIQGSSGDATIDARYDQSVNDVGGLELTAQNLATYTSTMSANHTVTVTHLAAIASFTAAGNYTDTLTYIGTANF